jgi:hypothetical protein
MINDSDSTNNTIIDRVEIIGPEGRELVRYLKTNEKCTTQLQDKGKTLKIFIQNRK